MLAVLLLLLFISTGPFWMISYHREDVLVYHSLEFVSGDGECSFSISRRFEGGPFFSSANWLTWRPPSHFLDIARSTRFLRALGFGYLYIITPGVGETIEVVFPYWSVVLLSLFLLLWRLWVLLIRKKRATPGICPGCGYDLRASPDRCPECGLIVLGKKQLRAL